MSRLRSGRQWTAAPPSRRERYAVPTDADAERRRWAREAVAAGHRTVETVAAFVGAAATCGCDAAQAEAALTYLVRTGRVVRGPGGYGVGR